MSPLIMKTCEMFARSGFEVELWIPWRNNRSFSGKDPFAYYGILRNFKIRRIPAIDFTGAIPGSPVFFLMLGTFISAVFIVAAVRGLFGRKTIFYFHDMRDAVALALFRPLIFIEIHDFYKSSAFYLSRWIFKKVTGFIVTNRIKIDTLIRDFGIVKEKILHQPNGVDIKKFSIEISRGAARERLLLPQSEKMLLYTGHLFGWKGVDTLFDAHRFLASGEVIYFVGGTDEDIEAYRRQRAALPVAEQEKIVVIGRKPHDEIPFWFRAADVLILPNTAKDPASKFETSPVKLFEYMASGRSIVAADLPSIRDVVDGRFVFFFEPDNPESLAKVIHSVFTDANDAQNRARASRQEIGRYSWEERTLHIAGFINKILQ